MRRVALLVELEGAVARIGQSPGFQAQLDLLFQVVYGLPFEEPVGLARFTCLRYLPIYVRHGAGVSAAELLNDPAAWLASHGNHLPGVPNDARYSGDAELELALEGLLDAFEFSGDLGMVAAMSCFAVDHAIHARLINLYEADDPAAFDHDRSGAKGASPVHEHVAYAPVAKREWCAVVHYLHTRPIEGYRDDVDIDAMEQTLGRWRESEYLWMKPDDST